MKALFWEDVRLVCRSTNAKLCERRFELAEGGEKYFICRPERMDDQTRKMLLSALFHYGKEKRRVRYVFIMFTYRRLLRDYVYLYISWLIYCSISLRTKTALDPLLNLYEILDFDICNLYVVGYDINVKASMLVNVVPILIFCGFVVWYDQSILVQCRQQRFSVFHNLYDLLFHHLHQGVMFRMLYFELSNQFARSTHTSLKTPFPDLHSNIKEQLWVQTESM